MADYGRFSPFPPFPLENLFTSAFQPLVKFLGGKLSDRWPFPKSGPQGGASSTGEDYQMGLAPNFFCNRGEGNFRPIRHFQILAWMANVVGQPAVGTEGTSMGPTQEVAVTPNSRQIHAKIIEAELNFLCSAGGNAWSCASSFTCEIVGVFQWMTR